MAESHLLSKPPSDVLLSVTTAAIRLEAELTDAALLMFDKLMGGLSRRAEGRASDNAAGALRDAQGHLRLLARAGRALIAAREEGSDAAVAVEQAVGGVSFLRAVAAVERLAQPECASASKWLIYKHTLVRMRLGIIREKQEFALAFGFQVQSTAERKPPGLRIELLLPNSRLYPSSKAFAQPRTE